MTDAIIIMEIGDKVLGSFLKSHTHLGLVVNTSNKQLQATGLYPRAKLISQLWMARLAFRDNTAESIPRSKGATDLSVFG